jgi:hypothetical protein
MLHRHMLLAAIPAVVVAAACGREAARADVPSDVTGSYLYVGADTTGAVPWAARAELQLRPDSTFEFDLRVRVQDENERETKIGRYRVDEDRLVLTEAGGKGDGFELSIRGDTLVLDAGWVAMAALRLVGVPRPVLIKGR